jgi:hypothetical protein
MTHIGLVTIVLHAPATSEAMEAYYRAHQADFAVPESVRLAYAELSLGDVAALVTITDAELQARYDQDKAQYVQAETRDARHILIAVDDPSQDAARASSASRAARLVSVPAVRRAKRDCKPSSRCAAGRAASMALPRLVECSGSRVPIPASSRRDRVLPAMAT